MAYNNDKMAMAVFLLVICTSSVVAQSVTIPTDTPLYPASGGGPSSIEVSFAPDGTAPQLLHFEGSIHNPSFLNGVLVSFWFDWTDSDGTAHTSSPEAFSLTPIMGTLTSHPGESFGRDFTIPYSPAEVSVHFANETSNSQDDKPVLVSGTLASVPEPAGIALVLVVASMLLPSLRIPRRK
jgi:hypothetical protein